MQYPDIVLTINKCDRKLPACSQCVAAKSECTGFSVTSSSTDVPRSVVRHLEYEIARLEKDLAQKGHLDALNGADILLQMPSSASHEEISNFNESRSDAATTVSIHDECGFIFVVFSAASFHTTFVILSLIWETS